MRATFTEEQTRLRESVLEAGKEGFEAARAAFQGTPWNGDAQFIEAFGGVGVPEELGGDGGGLVEAAIIAECVGRTLLPSDYPAHAAALQAARGAGLDVSEAVLGGRRWAVAAGSGLEVSSGRVHGQAKALVAPREPARAVLVTQELTALARPGRSTRRSGVDPARPAYVFDFDDVSPEAVAPVGDGSHRAYVIAAAELCGIAAGAVRLGADYAGQREQFGRPIGSFQGVAHQLADALVSAEAAWSLTLYAAWALDAEAPDARRVAHAAKASAGAAAIFAAERCVQVHGGIGITEEADPHLFLRRSLVGNAWLGDDRAHRRATGQAVLAARRASR